MSARRFKHSLLALYIACAWTVFPVGHPRAETDDDHEPFEASLQLSPPRRAPSRNVPMADAIPSREDADDERERFSRSIHRIQRLIAEGNLERARTELVVDLSVYPNHPGLLPLAAIVYTSLGEYERADQYWEKVADLADHHHEVLSMRGGVLLRVGDVEQAEEILKQAYAEQPYQALTAFHLVSLYAATGRMEQGAPLLKAMSVRNLALITNWLEEDYEALLTVLGVEPYRQMSELVLRGGESVPRPVVPAQADGFLPLTTADEDVSDLFAREEGEPDQEIERLRQRLNRAHQVLMRFGNAVQNEQWEDAARIGTHSGVARLGLTAPAFRAMAQYARFRAGEEDEAIRELELLRNRFPDSLYPALRLAETLLRREQYQEALEALNGMDTRFPPHVLEILLRSCALAEMGQVSAALERLTTLEDAMRPFVARWFAAHAPYQQAILNDDAYAAWRSEYFMAE